MIQLDYFQKKIQHVFDECTIRHPLFKKIIFKLINLNFFKSTFNFLSNWVSEVEKCKDLISSSTLWYDAAGIKFFLYFTLMITWNKQIMTIVSGNKCMMALKHAISASRQTNFIYKIILKKCKKSLMLMFCNIFLLINPRLNGLSSDPSPSSSWPNTILWSELVM